MIQIFEHLTENKRKFRCDVMIFKEHEKGKKNKGREEKRELMCVRVYGRATLIS